MAPRKKLQSSRTFGRRKAERGVTLIELMIAILVLTVGLAGLAQLLVVAAMNNTFAITTSGGVNDAQRLIEAWKAEAAENGISSSVITSSTWNSSTQTCAAFAALPGYVSADSRYKENVWVFDWQGNLVGSATPSLPPGISAGQLKAQALNSRLVYVRMEPKFDDPRTNQTVVLAAIVTGS